MESLAECGGVAISGTAFDQVKRKTKLGFEYLGEHSVKNISEPVRVYRILMAPEYAGKLLSGKKSVGKSYYKIFTIGFIAALAGVILIYQFAFRESLERASIENMAYSLPKDKPSIAVLPFDNLTGDSQQEYFCDGLTEEIISSLSQVPAVFVIARNSTFTYKDKPVKAQKVSEELGVQYILEGSVRKSEDHVRITAQLIDALSGKHVWAETYDKKLTDIFSIQDSITFNILAALQVKLSKDESTGSCSRGTKNIKAYLKVLQAVEHIYSGNSEGLSLARELYEAAIELDPNYSTAYSLLAWTHMLDVVLGGSKTPKENLGKAYQFTQKALSLNPSCSLPQLTLSYFYLIKKDQTKAVEACEKALQFDPNYSIAYAQLGSNLLYAGRSKEAIQPIEKAFRLNPKPPPFFYLYAGHIYYHNGMLEKAVTYLNEALKKSPNYLTVIMLLAASYSSQGLNEKAHLEIKKAIQIFPGLSVAYIAASYPFKNKSDLDRLLNDLQKAGLK